MLRILLCGLLLIAMSLEANTGSSLNLLSQKKHYLLPREPIDVVIPCGDSDIAILDRCIEGIKQNVKDVRRIIVVSAEAYTLEAEWFDEKNYPFSKYDLALQIFEDAEQADFYTSKSSRIGWIYQQLLKLYAPLVIPDISSNVLIVDSDTIFLQPVHFLGPSGEGLYNPGSEYWHPYFEHAARLIQGWYRVYSEYSGISHHMLFQREVIEDLFDIIERYHACEAWQAICRCIDLQHFHKSSMSEYEIYFNFIFQRTDQMQIRHLKWANISLRNLPAYLKQGYHYVSCHYYLR